MLPPIYLFGVWLSIVVAIGVTSLYAFQVTEEARKLSDALAATELVLTREQHLTQLDGLAAAAAHELGTPLSTIFLISRELEKTVQDNSPLAADLKTLREQAQRCRDILAKITQLSSTGAPFDRMPLSTLIEETVAPHRDFGVAIKVRIAVAGTREPVGTRNPAILYGVGNILENAVDFARDDGGGECVVEYRDRRDRDFRRRAGDCARHAEAHRRALSVAAAQRATKPKASTAASVSACSSPARCWSAPAPRSPSPTGFFPTMAPWSRSPGRAAASKTDETAAEPALLEPRLDQPVTVAWIDFMRPWQRRLATPYVEDVRQKDARP